MNVIAIIAAFNEADIIEPALNHLIEEGISAYVIDNHSSDETAAIAARFIGRGVVGIESFPKSIDRRPERFDWRELLRRKEALARELDGDWFIHHDADEFRESPWPGVRLIDAIARVDAAGYNAVDFELLNFRPTDDSFVPGTDPRPVIRLYERGNEWDRLQIKCWKKTFDTVDLASSGGHDAQFANRRVFPLRFVLRHYPVRGQAHGMRKVFSERRARLNPDERALGWHVQYEGLDAPCDFIANASGLTEYDADRIRIDVNVRHRLVEELEESLRQAHQRHEEVAAAHAALRDDHAALTSQFTRRSEEHDAVLAQLAEERSRRASAEAHADRLLDWSRQLENAQRDAQARLDAVHHSITWRWTSPARRVARWLLPRGTSR
jgi:hypothetical protein